jgi:hypothetical protein
MNKQKLPKEVQDKIDELIQDYQPKEVKEPSRELHLYTGIEGAKQYMRNFLRMSKTFPDSRKLTQEELDEIDNRVESMEWEPGMYKYTDTGVEYIGLYNSEIPDGVKLVKRGDQHYIEDWKDGWRVQWDKVTKKEFKTLMKKYGKTDSNETP